MVTGTDWTSDAHIHIITYDKWVVTIIVSKSSLMNQPPSSYIGERPSEHCLCLLMLINLHLVLLRRIKEKTACNSLSVHVHVAIAEFKRGRMNCSVLKIKISIFSILCTSCTFIHHVWTRLLLLHALSSLHHWYYVVLHHSTRVFCSRGSTTLG